jgi:hypothetical protein
MDSGNSNGPPSPSLPHPDFHTIAQNWYMYIILQYEISALPVLMNEYCNGADEMCFYRLSVISTLKHSPIPAVPEVLSSTRISK